MGPRFIESPNPLAATPLRPSPILRCPPHISGSEEMDVAWSDRCRTPGKPRNPVQVIYAGRKDGQTDGRTDGRRNGGNNAPNKLITISGCSDCCRVTNSRRRSNGCPAHPPRIIRIFHSFQLHRVDCSAALGYYFLPAAATATFTALLRAGLVVETDFDRIYSETKTRMQARSQEGARGGAPSEIMLVPPELS